MDCTEDLENVDWDSGGKVHNWKNYATDYVKKNWHNFDMPAKLAIWSVCQDASDMEDWD